MQKNAVQNAHMQASVFGYELGQAVDSVKMQLLLLAANSLNKDRLQRYFTFCENIEQNMMLRELAFISVQPEDSILLLNIDGKIAQISRNVAMESYGSPFQNFSPERREGFVQINPPQNVTYPLVDIGGIEQSVSIQVIRMSTPVYTAEKQFVGHLLLSFDIKALRNMLSLLSSAQSPLVTTAGNSPIVRSMFVDTQGWILFQSELVSHSQLPLSVDTVRSGIKGDSGSMHLDMAFRPTAAYNDYWSMVSNIQTGKGSRDSTQKYMLWQFGPYAEATTSFSPVFFTPAPNVAPVVIGGVVILTDAHIWTQATLDLMNRYALVGGGAFLLLAGGFGVTCYILLQPTKKLARGILDLCQSSRLHPLNIDPLPSEFAKIQDAVNCFVRHTQQLLDADKNTTATKLRQQQREVVALPSVPALVSDENGGILDCALVGESSIMQTLRQQIQKAAAVQADVLVIGETGTGKEVAAVTLHKLSRRHAGPFISINCGALDENLLMDTLFGHVKGAFTEAKGERKGAFIAACGGTLMLDEVGNASPRVQQALLRALSTRSIRPLGSDHEIPFDARIIAATNVDLLQESTAGNFREDLYYRLAVITIRTPALREHKEDILQLTAYFLALACAELQHEPVRLSKGALEVLMEADWPGNVRQLRNVLTRSVAFTENTLLLAENVHFESFCSTEGLYDILQNETDRLDEDVFSHTHMHVASPTVTLNPRQQQGLAYVMQHGRITRQSYQECIQGGIANRTAQYDLQEMVRLGVLHKEGRGPASYYTLPQCHSNQQRRYM